MRAGSKRRGSEGQGVKKSGLLLTRHFGKRRRFGFLSPSDAELETAQFRTAQDIALLERFLDSGFRLFFRNAAGELEVPNRYARPLPTSELTALVDPADRSLEDL